MLLFPTMLEYLKNLMENIKVIKLFYWKNQLYLKIKKFV